MKRLLAACGTFARRLAFVAILGAAVAAVLVALDRAFLEGAQRPGPQP